MGAFQGNIDCSANPDYPTALADDWYVVSVAGKIGGSSGVAVAVNDQIRAQADNPGGTQAAVGAYWAILKAIPDDLHSAIKDDLVQIAVDLFNAGRFPGLPSVQNIVNQTIKDESNVDNPVIWFTIGGEREENKNNTLNSIGRIYPVRVAFLAKDVVLPEDETKFVGWRKVLFDAYHQRPQDKTTGFRLLRHLFVCGTEVVPDVVFDAQYLQWKKVASGLLVKCQTTLRR